MGETRPVASSYALKLSKAPARPHTTDDNDNTRTYALSSGALTVTGGTTEATR